VPLVNNKLAPPQRARVACFRGELWWCACCVLCTGMGCLSTSAFFSSFSPEESARRLTLTLARIAETTTWVMLCLRRTRRALGSVVGGGRWMPYCWLTTAVLWRATAHLASRAPLCAPAPACRKGGQRLYSRFLHGTDVFFVFLWLVRVRVRERGFRDESGGSACYGSSCRVKFGKGFHYLAKSVGGGRPRMGV